MTGKYGTDHGVWFAGKHVLKNNKDYLQQCYLGLHLIALFPEKKVALVEGASTAIMASIVYPEYNWLATGGSWSDPNKFNVLAGCDVVLWPDSGKFDKWSRKAIPLQGIASKLTVSDYVEKHAYKLNLDLRDLLCSPQWVIQSRVVYGELLVVCPADEYPPEWDG